MVDCPNCNRFYNDDFAYCPYCGTKKPEGKICPKCKFKSIEYSYCPHCGKKLIPIQHLKNNKHKKKNTLKYKVQKNSAKSPKFLELYTYLNSLDNVKNRIMIERRIRAGEITTIEEIDEIRIPKKFEKRNTSKNKPLTKKQELLLYLDKTNRGPNIKIKIREKILNGQITEKSQIDSYDPLKGGSSVFGFRHYRDGYDEDYEYMRDLYR